MEIKFGRLVAVVTVRVTVIALVCFKAILGALVVDAAVREIEGRVSVFLAD